jgi:hypothetical protein
MQDVNEHAPLLRQVQHETEELWRTQTHTVTRVAERLAATPLSDLARLDATSVGGGGGDPSQQPPLVSLPIDSMTPAAYLSSMAALKLTQNNSVDIMGMGSSSSSSSSSGHGTKFPTFSSSRSGRSYPSGRAPAMVAMPSERITPSSVISSIQAYRSARHSNTTMPASDDTAAQHTDIQVDVVENKVDA